MIKSMTGFGKGRSTNRIGMLTVEIRSLNHKYFDIICRLPNHLSVFEDKVRDYVKKKIRRGRINLFVSWECKQKEKAPFSVNLPLAKKYQQELLKLKKGLQLKDDLGITQIISFPDIIIHEPHKEDLRRIWPYLKRALDKALTRLIRMRESEGKRLARDLNERSRRINFYLRNIEAQIPRVLERYKKRLVDKVQQLSGAKKLDQGRVAEEVALFARNSDVSEELTRIKSHLKGLKMVLRNQKEAGKEMDFIAQEMFREANTIGAKANDFRISRWVIKIKSQIEKMREQLQNVE